MSPVRIPDPSSSSPNTPTTPSPNSQTQTQRRSKRRRRRVLGWGHSSRRKRQRRYEADFDVDFDSDSEFQEGRNLDSNLKEPGPAIPNSMSLEEEDNVDNAALSPAGQRPCSSSSNSIPKPTRALPSSTIAIANIPTTPPPYSQSQIRIKRRQGFNRKRKRNRYGRYDADSDAEFQEGRNLKLKEPEPAIPNLMSPVEEDNVDNAAAASSSPPGLRKQPSRAVKRLHPGLPEDSSSSSSSESDDSGVSNIEAGFRLAARRPRAKADTPTGASDTNPNPNPNPSSAGSEPDPEPEPELAEQSQSQTQTDHRRSDALTKLHNAIDTVRDTWEVIQELEEELRTSGLIPPILPSGPSGPSGLSPSRPGTRIMFMEFSPPCTNCTTTTLSNSTPTPIPFTNPITNPTKCILVSPHPGCIQCHFQNKQCSYSNPQTWPRDEREDDSSTSLPARTSIKRSWYQDRYQRQQRQREKVVPMGLGSGSGGSGGGGSGGGEGGGGSARDGREDTRTDDPGSGSGSRLDLGSSQEDHSYDNNDDDGSNGQLPPNHQHTLESASDLASPDTSASHLDINKLLADFGTIAQTQSSVLLDMVSSFQGLADTLEKVVKTASSSSSEPSSSGGGGEDV